MSFWKKYRKLHTRDEFGHALDRKLGLRHHDRGMTLDHVLRVARLMRRRLGDERNENARHARRAKLGDARRARAADHHVAVLVSGRHVVDEGNDLGLDAELFIGLAHGRVAVLARLMNDDRTLLLRNGRKDGGHVVVEDLGAEAAAEDEDANGCANQRKADCE